MGERRYSRFLTVLLIIIIIAVIGLAGYLGYDYYKNLKTSNDADQFVSTFVEEVDNNDNDTNENAGSIAEGVETADVSTKGGPRTSKGYNVIGTIEIPKTNVNYPILTGNSIGKMLEVAVVAIYPLNAEVNTPGNIVISGHNYRNSLFFSNNKKLANGDIIYITDLNGDRVKYTIYSIFQTSVSDTGFYNRDTDGAKEITLSTCTDASNDQRLIVLARAE